MTRKKRASQNVAGWRGHQPGRGCCGRCPHRPYRINNIAFWDAPKKMIVFLILLLCDVYFVNAQSSIESIYVLNQHILAANKKQLEQNDPFLLPAYRALLKEADKDLGFSPVSVMEKDRLPPSGNKHDYISLAPYWWPDPATPGGLPYIRKDGQTNPEVKEYKDKVHFVTLCDKVFTLSLAYYFSGEEKYATHAVKLLRIWFLDTATRMNPNMKYAQLIKGRNTGRGAGLIDARHLIRVINAVGLLKSSPAWNAADENNLKEWLNSFLGWMQTSKNGMHEEQAANNHGVWYDALRLSIALYIDSNELAKRIIYHAESRLNKQMNSSGEFPLELKRTKSLHYTVFAMRAFFNIAQMAESMDVDFWNYISPTGKSLKKGFDNLKSYLLQEKKWAGSQIEKFDYNEAIPLLEAGYLQYKCTQCLQYLKTNIEDQSDQAVCRLLLSNI